MASAPLIGISGRTKTGDQINVKPANLRELQVDLYFSGYARGVLAAGGLPVFLPSDADPADYMGRLDGLLLTGGADIDPARYGQTPSADLFTPEPARDAYELALLDGAADARMPVLGICRGVQVLNVHGGGTLHQHVAPHACFDRPPNALAHRVDLTAGSLVASIYGPSVHVNSLHHQASTGWPTVTRRPAAATTAPSRPSSRASAPGWECSGTPRCSTPATATPPSPGW